MCLAFDFTAQTVCCGRPPRHERGKAHGAPIAPVAHLTPYTHTKRIPFVCGGVLHGSSSSSRGGWWFWFWWFHTVTHEHGTMLVLSSSQIDRTRASPPPPQHPRIVDGSMSSRGASPPAAPGRAFVARVSGRSGVEWALAHGAGFPTLRNTAGAVAQPAGGGGGACDEPLQTPANEADDAPSLEMVRPCSFFLACPMRDAAAPQDGRDVQRICVGSPRAAGACARRSSTSTRRTRSHRGQTRASNARAASWSSLRSARSWGVPIPQPHHHQARALALAPRSAAPRRTRSRPRETRAAAALSAATIEVHLR